MANPVVHWEITARDGPKQQQFYRQLFDWQVSTDNPLNYAYVNTGGGGINGGILQQTGRNISYVTIYVYVDDLQTYLDKAEQLGGKTVMPPTAIPNVGKLALFQDPEGNFIGLFNV
jgi:predicted enzyme related to lactoylglutathione lyase